MMKESIYRIYSEANGSDEFLVKAVSAKEAFSIVKEYIKENDGVKIFWVRYPLITDNFIFKPTRANTTFLEWIEREL